MKYFLPFSIKRVVCVISFGSCLYFCSTYKNVKSNYYIVLSQKTNLFSNLKLEQLLFEVVSRNSTGCNLDYQCTLPMLIYDIKYSERDLRLSCGFIVKKFFSLRISKVSSFFYLNKKRKKKRTSGLSHPSVPFCICTKQQFCIIKSIQESVH